MFETRDVHELIAKVLNFLSADRESEANLLVSNFYHRERTTLEHYINFLRLIYEDEGYVRANKHTQEAVSKILYMLDKRYSGRRGEVYVARRGNTYKLMKNASA